MTRWVIRLSVPAAVLALLAAPAVGTRARAQADDLPNPFGRSFFADHRAHSPGDILTVLIVEAASATESAQTSTTKSDGLSASVSSPAHVGQQWQGSLGDDFTGTGQIQRSGQLVAQLSIVVDRIDDNGNLWVSGEQEIVINGERQKIRLKGMVRPDDIGPDNTVPSWRVSHAQIAFVGKGVLAGSQSPGLITRILRWLRLD